MPAWMLGRAFVSSRTCLVDNPEVYIMVSSSPMVGPLLGSYYSTCLKCFRDVRRHAFYTRSVPLIIPGEAV